MIPGTHHFDIIDQYVDRASPIVRAIVTLARSG